MSPIVCARMEIMRLNYPSRVLVVKVGTVVFNKAYLRAAPRGRLALSSNLYLEHCLVSAMWMLLSVGPVVN